MGVLNITPDSFSDGGKFTDPDLAFARAVDLEEQGADIIDIGAESTRPGSARISAAEEMRRLIPVLKRLKDKLSIPISVDTYKAEVAERALDLGVEIINDPSGLTFEPQLSRVVAKHDAAGPGDQSHARQAGNVGQAAFLARPRRDYQPRPRCRREPCALVGVDKTRAVVIDPGLGFGKRKEQNSLILGRLPQLRGARLPIMVGPSRKSFLAHATGEETQFATAAAVAACVLGGAHIVRVHDVRECARRPMWRMRFCGRMRRDREIAVLS